MYQYLSSATTKINKKKRENSAVNYSGCTVIFMVVSVHLKNVRPTSKIINEKYRNGHIIIFTMEGKLDLPMLPDISIQAHIFLT